MGKLGMPITLAYLRARTKMLEGKGYDKPRWITFCEVMIEHGLSVYLKEAKSTVSKYIMVTGEAGARPFKVRFSNHRPNRKMQEREDSDFYVGVSNGKVATTNDAIAAVLEHHKVEARLAS